MAKIIFTSLLQIERKSYFSTLWTNIWTDWSLEVSNKIKIIKEQISVLRVCSNNLFLNECLGLNNCPETGRKHYMGSLAHVCVCVCVHARSCGSTNATLIGFANADNFTWHTAHPSAEDSQAKPNTWSTKTSCHKTPAWPGSGTWHVSVLSSQSLSSISFASNSACWASRFYFTFLRFWCCVAFLLP